MDLSYSSRVVHGNKALWRNAHSLKSISTKTLIEHLRELEVPPRVEYTLTERAESLRSILQAMTDWATTGDPERQR